MFLNQDVRKASAGKGDHFTHLYPLSVRNSGVFHSYFEDFGSQCFQQLLSWLSLPATQTQQECFGRLSPPALGHPAHRQLCADVVLGYRAPPGRNVWVQVALGLASDLAGGTHIPRL